MKSKVLIVLLISIILSSSVLTACSMSNVQTNSSSQASNVVDVQATADASKSQADAEMEAAEEVIEKSKGGSPWINSEIKSNISENTQTDPKDDFHLYANKDWLLSNEIPAGYTEWDHYNERGNEVKKQCIELLSDDSVTGHDADLVKTYNQLLLDWDARNQKGISEIYGIYNQIVSASSISDITKLLTQDETKYEVYNFMRFDVSLSLNNPDTNIVYINLPTLLLKDSAEYSVRTEYGDILYGYNRDMFTYLAAKFNIPSSDAHAIFDDAIALETLLSQRIYTTTETYKNDYFDKINNEMTYQDVIALAGTYPLGEITASLGIKYWGKYLVTRPDYFELLDQIYNDEHLQSIKNLMLVRYLNEYARSLDKETYLKSIELYNEYYGTVGMLSDEEMAYDNVVSALPASMQKVYIQKYGSPEDRKKMEELCREVIDTYRELLSESEWVSPEVKKYAIEKLNKITINAAYPDRFRDTSNLDISNCSLIEAKKRINKAEIDFRLSYIGRSLDRRMWAEGTNILDCNAFYSCSQNTIFIIIGMMGEPFYSSDMSIEELYASIGAFWVGHEISHAFDSIGALYDANGTYRNWWTDADKEEFNKRVAKMDSYLDNIIAFDDLHFIGTNIDGEMIADMTGLQCALRMASKVENFDYDKFFTKYAQMNGSLAIYSSELSQLLQNEHPLNYSRTNVPVQQFQEFYDTYDIKEGDKMYLAPKDRLVIW